jgi:uncharacterized protein YydD (DUF2326 family)
MYLKHLVITGKNGIIRKMDFKQGVNLIIDNTEPSKAKMTGNNVGKTTVLKLIDFCLGANGKIIYTDTENKKSEYIEVKEFLIDEEVLISLILTDDIMDENARTVEIERNFLHGKKAIRRINGKEILEKEYETELWKFIFKTKPIEKPSFRQVISHCIRYKNENIDRTLKTLNQYTKDVEYETLYLYLLGCSVDEGERKQQLSTKLKQEQAFKDRLESKQKRTAYEMALALVEEEISSLDEKKKRLGLNASTEIDIENLNKVKMEINRHSSLLSKLTIRKSLIEEAKKELVGEKTNFDISQVKMLYNEAKINIDYLTKTFEELVNYHNKMVVEKIKFITSDLPIIEEKISNENAYLSGLLEQEKILSVKISRGEAFAGLEEVISELNDKYRQKGEYESIIAQILETEGRISEITVELNEIDNYLFSKEFEERLKRQVVSFNKYFATISRELYDEQYALTYQQVVNKNGTKVYKFDSFNANMSSGKKQGEILCFDLAYMMFAQEEGIPCLGFILNDKKELMSDNQLIKIAEYIQSRPMQVVVSMLKDKVPERALDKSYVVVELSQKDKLLKIEQAR